MAAPLDPHRRATIEQAIRDGAGAVSCRALAAEHGVSTRTVGRIAREIGLPDAFTRETTKAATTARVADLAARRAGLAAKMLDLAEHFAARATGTYVYWVATKDDVQRVELDEPPLGEVRQAMTAVGIAVDKHMALIRFDTKDGADQRALSLVDALVNAFGVHPDLDGAGVDDGYPVPLPTAEQLAAGEHGIGATDAEFHQGTS